MIEDELAKVSEDIIRKSVSEHSLKFDYRGVKLLALDLQKSGRKKIIPMFESFHYFYPARPNEILFYTYKTTHDLNAFEDSENNILKLIESAKDLPAIDGELARIIVDGEGRSSFLEERSILLEERFIPLDESMKFIIQKMIAKNSGKQVIQQLMTFPDVTKKGSDSHQMIKHALKFNPKIVMELLLNSSDFPLGYEKIVSNMLEAGFIDTENLDRSINEVLDNIPPSEINDDLKRKLSSFKSVVKEFLNPDSKKSLSIEELISNYRSSENQEQSNAIFDQIVLEADKDLLSLDKALGDEILYNQKKRIENSNGISQLVDYLIDKGSGQIVLSKLIENFFDASLNDQTQVNYNLIKKGIERGSKDLLNSIDINISKSMEKNVGGKEELKLGNNKKLLVDIVKSLFVKHQENTYILNLVLKSYRDIKTPQLETSLPLEIEIIETAIENLPDAYKVEIAENIGYELKILTGKYSAFPGLSGIYQKLDGYNDEILTGVKACIEVTTSKSAKEEFRKILNLES